MADEQTFTTGGITVGQLRNLRFGSPTPPAPPAPRKLGALQELVRAPFALGGGAIRGVGQLAADTPLTEQGNLLQRVGQGIQERNASDIQGFGEIADRPVATAGAMAGGVLGSIAAYKAPSAIGTALTALSVPAAFVPYAGPALSTILRGAGTALRVGGAAGVALGTASSLGVNAAAQYAQDRAELLAQDPANAESLGAKAAAGANAIFSGLVESRLGVEAGLARSALGKTLLDEVKAGTRRQLIGRAALKYGLIEGAESLPQAVGSQLATFKNPLTADSLEDTAFQTVMGLGGGGMFGAVRGAIANPGTVSNDDLKGAVDPALTPEAPPPVQEVPSTPPLALPAPTDFVGTVDGELARPGQIEAEQQQVIAAIEARASALEAAGRTEEALNLRGSAYGLLAPERGVQAMLGLMPGTNLPEQREEPSAAPESMQSLFLSTLEPGQGVQAMLGLMPGSPAPVQRGVPRADPASMGALFGQVPAASTTTAQPAAPEVPQAPTSFRAILASNPDISLKGVPSTVRNALDAAATPEDVAAIAAQEYHSRMARNSNANYVHEPNGLLQSLYRTVTGGQEIPSRAEFEAQQQAQEIAAQGQQVQPAIQPEVVQAPAQEVQPQIAIPEAQVQPEIAQTAAPAVQPQVQQPPPPKLTKAQERVRAADRSALEVSRQEADAAAQQLMDDELTKGARARAEAAIDRFEKKQAEFDAKYAPRASRSTTTQTDTPAFKRWFGDSKVVDDQGRPLVVYHGTTEDFDAFDAGKAGSRTDAGWLGKGFYFSDQEIANAYSGHFSPEYGYLPPSSGIVYPVYLSLQNPAVLIDTNMDGARTAVRKLLDLPDSASAKQVRAALLAAGYDGVIYDRSSYGQTYREYVAFRPEQIKSAVGNQGTFDPANPDIRRSSSTAQPGNPHTVTTIREALTNILGRSAMVRLARKFVIVQDVQAMRDDMARRGSPYSTRIDGTEKGLYDPSTDTSYIVASNMSATDSPWGVFLHEVGVHYGLRKMLGAKGHAATLRDVNRLLREGDAAMVAAAQQVNRAEQLGLDPTAPDFATQFADRILGQPQLGEEVVGYFAENPANHNRSVWKRIVTAVRNFLRSIGINRPVTSDDIAAVVIASARRAAQDTSAVTSDTMARDAQEALQQFGYTARPLQDGTVDILDANGQVVADEDIADAAQLAATIVKYPDMREQLAKDVTETGPLFSGGSRLGPTVQVDGIERPTTNSRGQPIHPTLEGVQNFWRWFGDSKVVDEQGRPVVVYHGTASDIVTFDLGRAGTRDHGWYGGGVYLTAEPAYASAYANSVDADVDADIPTGSNVLPSYVALSNPYVWPEGRAAATTISERDALTQELKTTGYDGVIVANPYQDPEAAGFYEVIAFTPTQIKSATGNTGAFSPTSPSISASRATGPTSADTQETLDQYGQATNSLRALGAQVVSRLTKGNRDTISAMLLRVAARWADREHLVEMYDDRYGGALRKNATTYANQEVIASRFNQLFNNPYQKLEALERSDPKTHAALTNLMTATELQIDPRKSWEDQPHLHALPEAEQAAVKQHAIKFKQSWGKLSPEHKQIYNDLVDMNEMMFMADMAVTLQNITHANIPEGSVPADLQTDITDAFRNRPDTHESIAAAKKYWAGELDRYTKAVAKYAADQRVNIPTKAPQTPELKAATAAALKGIPPGPARDKIKRDLARGREAQLTAEQKQIVRRLSPLEAQVKIIAEGLAKIAKAPYFHLGRFGDYFISTKVRLGEDGKADPVAMRQVAETLGKDFPEVSIRMDATDPIIVTRFESVDTAQSFIAALKKLQAQGLLQQDINEAAYVKGVKSQVRGKPVTPEWLQQAIEGIHAEDYGDASDGGEGQRIADQLISDLRRMYLESLPDLSSAKVMARRIGRQGYSTDMVRSFAHRMRVASAHIAGTAVSPARRASMKQVRDVQYAAQQDPSVSLDEQNKLGIIADEFRQREIDLDNMPQTPGLAMLRAASHAFFLAMSPAYMMLNVSQVGAVAWPELTKRFGGVKSFNALVRVTPMAGKVIRAAITEGYKARGVRGALDAVVTSDILKAAGIPTDIVEYLVEMMGTGKLDIGNATRELARVAEGEIGGPNSERASEVLRLATSTSYMSEIFSRTIVALAARELNGTNGAVPYAARVLDQAMLNYNFTNLGRATGKKGIFGEFTPVVVQFHQYQFQMLAKLYREIYRGSGLGKNVSPTQQAEARQFLKAHAAAVTLLAGTMGLPFMTVAARLSDMLCEMFSDQPCDTKASIRNFTSDIVGEDIEPLLSRGLPRLLGADISDRAGEADLLPGSRFLADRRTLTEKLKNPSIAISGAVGGMMASIVEGIQMAADGDWLGGAQRALPLAIQGPVKAYQLSEQGFTDRNGNKLPMTPHALEILGQVLGFQPGQKADYSQAARTQQQRAAILTREGALIRRNLAVAFERGDREAMLEWGRKAEGFAQQNPGLDILPGLASSIRQRQRARNLVAAGVPPGASVRDTGAFGATRFFQPEAVQ